MIKNNAMILIDNGHGAETPGKRSPDGALQEWKWTRQVAAKAVAQLQRLGLEARLLVPEDEDVGLRERARRANAAKADLLVSIHVNASGDGSSWRDARGWSAIVAPKAGKESRRLATLLCTHAAEAGFDVRRQAPGRPYWEQSLAICRDTRCPAVLTENLFMDNWCDCQMLLPELSQDVVAMLHAQAISDFMLTRSR